MNNQQIIILLSFGAVSLLVFVIARIAMERGEDGRLRGRLEDGASQDDLSPGRPRVQTLLSNIGQAASRPFMPTRSETQFVIRRNLARAGIYTPSGIRLVTGAKAICLFVGIALGYAAGTYLDMMLMGLSIGGIMGYLSPLVWLKFKTSANQRSLTNGLADALDLMVVCVEAGLTVDAAMQRVGSELGIAHPSLSRELGMAHMETRVGLSRVESLRNMGQRTGNPALQSLASILIQAERFGTSIADALRVHSETLRINRQMKAEEMAGKASVKISFPLVLCIFPATFIVLAGPTIIQLMKSPLFN
jgi:tight adherence protein C